MTDITNTDGAATSRSRWQTFLSALGDALLALYETVRCYVMPLLIGCLLIDLGAITGAMTTLVTTSFVKGGQHPDDLIVANLYAITSTCTVMLIFILVGMGFWAMRSAFLWNMKRNAPGGQLQKSDRITIFLIEALSLGFPLTIIYGGLRVVRGTNFLLRHYLKLPAAKITRADTGLLHDISQWGLAHPVAVVLIAIVLYTALATLRIYVDERRSLST